MANSRSFSEGVDDLLDALRPYGRQGAKVFPPMLDGTQARRGPGENLHQWFVRVVDQFCVGDPKRTAVEDQLAVFLKLGWNDQRRLVYANIQTIVTDSDLDDYYCDVNVHAQYLRLDLDYKTLGDPFSHPLAHIHVEGDLSPRFALEGGISGNIVVDYLEFLYRNYFWDKWLEWAEREWNQEFIATSKEGDVNFFSIIVDAFKLGQFRILQDHADLMSRIKRTLRKRKDELFDLHMDGADRELLEYPLAR
jgi:hypothetical protein